MNEFQRGYFPNQNQPQRHRRTQAQQLERQQYQQAYQPQYQQPQQYQQPYPVQYQQPQQYQTQPFQPQYQQPAAQLDERPNFFKQRSMVLLVCSAIAVLWFLIVVISINGTMNAAPVGGDEWDQAAYEIGSSIGLALMMPFLVVSFIGTVFSCLSWLLSKKGFALTAGILFTVSLFIGGGNVIGFIPCAVLAYIGYAKLKKGLN